MNEQRTVSPKSIYPLVTIESIDPDTLERIVKETKNGAGIPPIKVVEFRGYYFIWEGNYEMLAANITGKEQIDIEKNKDVKYVKEVDSKIMEIALKIVELRRQLQRL